MWHNGVQFDSLRQHDSADLESGSSSSSSDQHSSRTAAATLAATISSFGLGSIGSSIGQLVRRQTTPGGAHQQHSHPHHLPSHTGASTTESAGMHATDSTRDGQNSSDASVESHESTDFLLKVRVCGLVDMLGLVYRTALPMPYWALYFYLCPTIGTVLRIFYIAAKFYDLSWKARGAAEAFMHFVTSKIVRCFARCRFISLYPHHCLDLL